MFSIKQCGIKMQVQRQQVYAQEQSGLDQPSPNNHKTQTLLFFFFLQPAGRFSLSGSWGGPIWREKKPIQFILHHFLQLVSKSTETFFLEKTFHWLPVNARLAF